MTSMTITVLSGSTCPPSPQDISDLEHAYSQYTNMIWQLIQMHLFQYLEHPVQPM